MSTSGSVFDDACCSTFWMRLEPGIDVRSMVTPSDSPHFVRVSPMTVSSLPSL